MTAPARIVMDFGYVPRTGGLAVYAEWDMLVEYIRADLARPTPADALALPEVAALVEACRAWGMHIEPDEITADDPFREIRAALAALSTPPTDGDKA